MMSKHIIVIAFTFLLWTSSAALAQQSPAGFWKDGSALLELCKEGEEADRHNGPGPHPKDIAWGLCRGFIDGVRHGIWFSARVRVVMYGVQERPLYCVAEEPNAAAPNAPEDRIGVVIRHLEQNPQSLHMSPAFLVAEALAKAFPCQ